MFVLLCNDGLPWLSIPILKLLWDEWFDGQLVFSDIVHKIWCPHELSNFDELVIIVISLKHWIFLKYHVAHCASQWPDIQRVIVVKIIDQQLRPFIVSRSDSYIVRFFWYIVFGESPVNDSQLSKFMVNHDIMRFDVSMHDAHWVTIIKSFQYLVNVESAVKVSKCLIQISMVETINSFKDKGRYIRNIILHTVIQLNNIRSSIKSLQNLDLSSDFLHFDRLQNLYHAFLIIDIIDSIINLWVFASS